MKFLLVVIMLTGILFAPSIARADFFNDGRWYMDSSQWELITNDIENRTSLVDQDNRLEYITAPGWTGPYEPIRSYVSKWAFDLNYDFEFNVGFHYGHIATQYPNDYGTVVTGLFYGTDSYFATGASSDVHGDNKTPVKEFWTSMAVPGKPLEENKWDRTYDNGVLYAHYDSLNDKLQFSAEGGAKTYTGLKSELELTQLGVFFAGGSDGASLASGDAYLKNFVVSKGNVIPEPASLSLLGLGLLGLFGLKRKGNK